MNENLVRSLDELNDLAEGVLAVPMPINLDREKVICETDAAIKKLLNP